MSDLKTKIELLNQHVSSHPDFPKPGVLFRDMFSLFRLPKVAVVLREVLVEYAKTVKPAVDVIVALDARGFVLGPLIALELGIPFVPIRKKGKLPGEVISVSYSLEYGKDTLEMQVEGVTKGQTALVVDDLLATGGSLGAACQLVERLGGKVAACLVLMELVELKGQEKVPTKVLSILEY